MLGTLAGREGEAPYPLRTAPEPRSEGRMRGWLLGVPLVLILAGAARAADLTATMYRIDTRGTGEAVGTVAIGSGGGGAVFTTDLEGLAAGRHGFHVHANGDCGPGHLVARMQSESSYIKSLAEIGCLEDMNNFKGLAYPCNNAIPRMNWLLMLGVLALVATFRSSGALASAYGIAVTGTMGASAVLAGLVAATRWGWGPGRTARRSKPARRRSRRHRPGSPLSTWRASSKVAPS